MPCDVIVTSRLAGPERGPGRLRRAGPQQGRRRGAPPHTNTLLHTHFYTHANTHTPTPTLSHSHGAPPPRPPPPPPPPTPGQFCHYIVASHKCACVFICTII